MSIGSLGVSAGNLASLQALVFSYIPYSPPYSADPQYRSSFSINATTNVTINLWLLDHVPPTDCTHEWYIKILLQVLSWYHDYQVFKRSSWLLSILRKLVKENIAQALDRLVMPSKQGSVDINLWILFLDLISIWNIVWLKVIICGLLCKKVCCNYG